MSMEYIGSVQVVAEWDPEARVWVATSDDVPGLVAEHSDFAALQTMVAELVPTLMIENGLLSDPENPAGGQRSIPIHIAAHAASRVQAPFPVAA